MYVKIKNKYKNTKVEKKIKNGGTIIKKFFGFNKIKLNNDCCINYKTFFSIEKNSTKESFIKITKVYNKRLKRGKLVKIKSVEKNDLYALNKGFTMSSNDIVQGIPKLNSLLEAFYKTTNLQFKINTFSVKYKFVSFDITPTQIKYNNFIDKNLLVLSNKFNLRENKDPENFAWFLITTYNHKIAVEKNFFYNLLKTKTFIANSLQKVYREQNILVARKTFESIINTMFSRIIVINPLCNPFLRNEKLSLKLYFKIIKVSKLSKTIAPIALPFIDGISKSVYEGNKVLSVISFRDAITNITKKCLYGSKDWLNSIKAKLLIGQQLNLGTRVTEKSNKYHVIRDFIMKNKTYK